MPKSGKAVAEAGEKITPRKGKKLVEGGLERYSWYRMNKLLVLIWLKISLMAATGQVYFEAGHEITAEDLAELDELDY